LSSGLWCSAFSFIYGLFNDAVSSSRYNGSNGRIVSKKLIGRNLEGFDHSLLLDTRPRGTEKKLKKPVRTIGVSAGNRKRHLTNMNQKGYAQRTCSVMSCTLVGRINNALHKGTVSVFRLQKF
jgi:hypothetical protein